MDEDNKDISTEEKKQDNNVKKKVDEGVQERKNDILTAIDTLLGDKKDDQRKLRVAEALITLYGKFPDTTPQTQQIKVSDTDVIPYTINYSVNSEITTGLDILENVSKIVSTAIPELGPLDNVISGVSGLVKAIMGVEDPTWQEMLEKTKQIVQDVVNEYSDRVQESNLMTFIYFYRDQMAVIKKLSDKNSLKQQTDAFIKKLDEQLDNDQGKLRSTYVQLRNLYRDCRWTDMVRIEKLLKFLAVTISWINMTFRAQISLNYYMYKLTKDKQYVTDLGLALAMYKQVMQDSGTMNMKEMSQLYSDYFEQRTKKDVVYQGQKLVSIKLPLDRSDDPEPWGTVQIVADNFTVYGKATIYDTYRNNDVVDWFGGPFWDFEKNLTKADKKRTEYVNNYKSTIIAQFSSDKENMTKINSQQVKFQTKFDNIYKTLSKTN